IYRKRSIAARYDAALAEIGGLEPPPRAAWASPSLWLYTARLDPRVGIDRKQLWARLREQRIETRPIWSPLHTMPMDAGGRRRGGGTAVRRVLEPALLVGARGARPGARDRRAAGGEGLTCARAPRRRSASCTCRAVR